MAIRFLPNEMLRKAAPKKLVEKLVSKDLTVNRAAVTMLENTGVLTKKKITDVAIKVIRGYRENYKEEIAAGVTKTEAVAEAVAGKKLMVSRVQNSVVQEIAKDIKSAYRGEFYEWLPSDAEIPDPLHQLKYGKKFQLGKGEMPGDRYGCRCGMRILVTETQLAL